MLKDTLKDPIDEHEAPQKKLSDKRIKYELDQLIKRTKEVDQMLKDSEGQLKYIKDVEQMLKDSENGKREEERQRTEELLQQKLQGYHAEWQRTRPLDDGSEGEASVNSSDKYPKIKSDKHQQAERRQEKFYDAIRAIFSKENAKYTPTAKARALQRFQKKIWKRTNKKMSQESEQVTRTVLEAKEKELSQVKAARDKEIAMLKGAIQDAEDKETAMLEGTTQDVTVNPQCQEPQGKKTKERLVIRGYEDRRDRRLKEDCALCKQKGHWREGDEECKASKDETPERALARAEI